MTIGAKVGWGLTGLFALFMLGASIAPKLAGMAVADETMVVLGWDPRFVLFIGMMELALLLLYLLPRTSILGAVLMTALLGGAIATQLRAGQPLFSHVLFGVYLGLVMWAGLWLRDPAVRAMLPVRAG
ncbi:DoxX family protein [Roseomonas sp. CAU 1739]|uniref:DoxX family protein n=1 Tax=Roseomonas sp. CAU 1739 TaxID=3140364 RepID=UPI00325B944F